MNTKTIAVVIALTGAMALTACQGDQTGGTATAPSSVSGTSTAAATSVALPSGASVGTYPSTPRQVPPLNTEAAWVAEGNRMGDALILPNEVDPRLLIGGAGLRSFPVYEATQLVDRLPDETIRVFDDFDMRAGMTTTRGDDLNNPTVALRVGMYRFDTADTAKQAVAAIAEKTASRRQVQVSSAKDAVASVFKAGTVDSYLAMGPLVLNVSGTAATDAAATELVAKGYDKELPKAKAFTPTPVAEVVKLPANPGGIVSLVLPNDSSSPTAELARGYMSLTGVLHRIANLDSAEIYRTAGVDLAAQGDAVLYRTRDHDAAEKLRSALYAKGTTEQPSPAGLPDVQCVQRTSDKTYRCGVVVGRYFADASSVGLADVQQRATAQYMILAAQN